MYLVTKTVITPSGSDLSVLFKVLGSGNLYYVEAVRTVQDLYRVGVTYYLGEDEVLKTFDSELDAALWYDDYTRMYEEYTQKRTELARQMLELDNQFMKEFS
jgi:hypothetical protein